MRILFSDNQIPDLIKNNVTGGGACVRLYALIKGLTHLGFQVGVLTWKGANSYVGKQIEFDLVES